MRKNKGFTLVELVISIAILAVVVLVVTSFMVTSGDTFARGNADSNVQKEAEAAIGQIEDLIIDVNGGVSAKDETATYDLIMYNATEESGTVSYTKEMIQWDKTEKELTYSKWDVAYDSATDTYTETGSPIHDKELLADNVENFVADLSDVYSEQDDDGSIHEFVRSVKFEIECKDSSGRSAYASTPIVTLRNRMMLSDDPEAVFDDVRVDPEDGELWISGSEISLQAIGLGTVVERGNDYSLYVFTKDSHQNITSQVVSWDILTQDAVSTISIGADGVGSLSVHTYESNSMLSIEATLSNGSKVAGMVTVEGELARNFTPYIIPVSMMELTANYDSKVETEGYTASEAANFQYEWKIPETYHQYLENKNSMVWNKTTFTLTVTKQAETNGVLIPIELHVTDPATGVTKVARTTYGPGIQSKFLRGMDGNEIYIHKVDDWPDTSQTTEWKWDWYVCDIYGNEIPGEKEELKKLNDGEDVIKLDQNVGGFGFNIKEGFPANRSAYIKVAAFGIMKDGSTWRNEYLYFLPAVSIKGQNHVYPQDNIYNNKTWVEVDVYAYYLKKWQYADINDKPYLLEVVDIQYDAPAGAVVTPKFEIQSANWERYDADPAYGTRYNIPVGFEVTGCDKGQVKLLSMTVKVTVLDQDGNSTGVSTYCNFEYQ